MCGRGCGEVWGGLGTVGGLACPKTLARTVEMWEVRAAVFWGSGAGLVALKRSRGCGTVGGPSGGLEQRPPTNSTSRLQHTAGSGLTESDLAKTIQGLGEGYPRLWNCGGSERGSGTTTPAISPGSRIWLRRKIFFFWPVEVWLLWHVYHGCGTVGGPSGGLEQQPPTNSTSRLQYTAGEASGGVGSEQSLRKTSSHDV